MTGKARIGGALAVTAMLATGVAGSARAEANPLHVNLAYDGRLYVKVLDVAVEQVLDSRAFSASAHVKTSGLLALFRKINLNAETQGKLENAVALPHTFTYLNTDGRKDRRVTATWTPSDVTTQSQPQFANMGDPAATREQRLEGADPLTILTRIATLPPTERPCQGVSQFYDGKQRYDLEYAFKGAAAPDARERGLGLTSAIRCDITYREVAGFKKKPPQARGQGINRSVTLGLGRLGPSGPWVISFLRADTFLGPAEIQLRQAKVTGQNPERLTRAALP